MHLLLIFLFLVLVPRGSLAAQSDTEETLKPVVVSTTRLKDVEEEAFRLPKKVVVITRDDIEKQGAKTVQEAIQYQTGIVLYDQIGNEFQSTVDMRGYNGQPVTATTVFVDGVRVNEPDFNQVNYDFIPIEDVEKIEILYGPGTVYGRNALGGVINITMKRGSRDKPKVSGESGGGSYFRQKYSFAADLPLPLPDFNYYFSGTRELSNGWRQDSAAHITRIFNKLGYSNGTGTDVAFSYTFVTDLLKQAGSLTQAQLDQSRRLNSTPGDFKGSTYNLLALNLRQQLPAGFSMAFNSFYRGNATESFIAGLTSVTNASNDYDQWGGTLQFTNNRVLNERNSFNLGFEYSSNRFTNDSSGSFSGFPFTLNTSSNEDVVGAYFLDTLNLLESLSLTGGVRFDWSRIDYTDRVTSAASFIETFNHFSPRAGIAFNPLPTLGMYFSYSQGFRTPTVQELPTFDPPTFTPSVAPLDPVTSNNFEVGIRGKLPPWLDANLVFFYTPVSDEILFVVTDPVNFFGQNVNISKSLRRGVEISLNGRYGKWLNGFLNYTYTKATFETNVLLFSGQVLKGNEFPLVPNHRVGFGLNVFPVEGLTVSLFGNYVSSQYLANDEPNQFEKLDPYFVLNGKVSYEWKDFTAFITGTNLTNNEFNTFGVVGGFPTQGFFVPFPTTTVFAGFKFHYGKK